MDIDGKGCDFPYDCHESSYLDSFEMIVKDSDLKVRVKCKE